MKRVVITGLGTLSSLGQNTKELYENIKANKSGIQKMDDWENVSGLQSLLAAPLELGDVKFIPRQLRRSMGRISIIAVKAAIEAIADAGIDKEAIRNEKFGCVMGSTMGGAEALNETFKLILPDYDIANLKSMNFFQCVSHTVAMNVAQYLGIKGTVMAPSSACASSLQALGTAYDMIRLGRQELVLCGGSEEVHPTVTGSFDVLFATSSSYNDDPDSASRPFDSKRDGIVCGEGAGVIVLEEYEHAKQRGAHIYAEVIGYDSCGSGAHISQSDRSAMVQCMNSALKQADIKADEVDLISAHATSTMQGDVEEAQAIKEVFGSQTPVNSLKGHIGHTLGASGAIELAVSLLAMQDGLILATRNLKEVAEDCSGIKHVTELINKETNIILKNCFAFGGINAALLCKKI